jgi:transposase
MVKQSEGHSPASPEALESLSVLNPRACGIDIGSRSHWASVPPERYPQCVREFGYYTPDLSAMESTGSYWIPVFEFLEKQGFEVLLVNAYHVKSVPGRK